MKTSFKLTGIALCAILFFGCSKNDEVIAPEDQLVKYLTSEAGNRVWRIQKVYENGVEKSLTTDQLNYTKTYTRVAGQDRKGTFTNSDGYTGTWTLPNTLQLIEVNHNAQTGTDVRVDQIINTLTQNKLDIESTANGKTVREVFYAL